MKPIFTIQDLIEISQIYDRSMGFWNMLKTIGPEYISGFGYVEPGENYLTPGLLTMVWDGKSPSITKYLKLYAQEEYSEIRTVVTQISQDYEVLPVGTQGITATGVPFIGDGKTEGYAAKWLTSIETKLRPRIHRNLESTNEDTTKKSSLS